MRLHGKKLQNATNLFCLLGRFDQIRHARLCSWFFFGLFRCFFLALKVFIAMFFLSTLFFYFGLFLLCLYFICCLFLLKINQNKFNKVIDVHCQLSMMSQGKLLIISIPMGSFQSYEIKSPPWTILWFRILGIFSIENIARLGVFMFQTSDNSQLLRRAL